MIRVHVTRDASGKVARFSVDGHAQAGDHGHDIVCAGVSTAVFGALMSCAQLAGVEIPGEQDEGYVHAVIPEQLSSRERDQVNLLMESLLCTLHMVRAQYPDRIHIQD